MKNLLTAFLLTVALTLFGCMVPPSSKGPAGAQDAPVALQPGALLDKLIDGLGKAHEITLGLATYKQDLAGLKAQAFAAADTNKDGVLSDLEKPAMVSGLSLLVLNYLRSKSRKELSAKVDEKVDEDDVKRLVAEALRAKP
jgi:hypothetical protein